MGGVSLPVPRRVRPIGIFSRYSRSSNYRVAKYSKVGQSELQTGIGFRHQMSIAVSGRVRSVGQSNERYLPAMGSQPLYERVREQIAAQIADGTYAPGARLPSEAIFAERFGINRLTVRRAIEELARAGHVQSRQGSGTYVTEPMVRAVVLCGLTVDPNIGGLTQQLRDLGHKCEHRFLRAKKLESGSGAAAIDLPRCQQWRVDSALNVDGTPWLWSRTWLPTALLDEPIRHWDSSVGAYGLIDVVTVGTTPIWRSLLADFANSEDADILDIRLAFPVLVLDQLDADSTGHPILRQSRRIRMDRITYVLRFADP